MTNVRELAKSLHTDLIVVTAALSQMGEFVPSENAELAPSLVRRVKDSLTGVAPKQAVIKYDLKTPVSVDQDGTGRGDDAEERPVLVPGSADADDTVDIDVDVTTGGDDSDSEDEDADLDLEDEDAQSDESGSDEDGDSGEDADSDSSKQDEYDLSEDAEADESEDEDDGEAPAEKPALYVDYWTGTLQDLADEANTEVEYLIALAGAFGYKDIDSSTQAPLDGGALFVKITLLLGYQILNPIERPEPDWDAAIDVGFIMNSEIEVSEDHTIWVGDALAIPTDSGRSVERVRAIFDEEGYPISMAGAGSVVTILGVFGIEGEVFLFPNDRAARDWVRVQ